MFENGKALMTHIVAGYPDLSTSYELARVMRENGADIVELQIPFTDPLADGQVIMDACSTSLSAGTTPYECFRLARRITGELQMPVCIMSYCNPVIKMGTGTFTAEAAKAGAFGLIVPDLPFDTSLGITLRRRCAENHLALVQVVSPGMSRNRLLEVVGCASGFVYATLKVGITGSAGQEPGSSSESSCSNEGFLSDLTHMTSLPVLAGFGISTAGGAAAVSMHTHGVVVGSHLIRLFNQEGISAVGGFVDELARKIKGRGCRDE